MVVKLLAIILSVFLFHGAISACGISDLPCSQQTEQTEESSDCCKKSTSHDTDDTQQGDMSCCQGCMQYTPSLLPVMMSLSQLPDLIDREILLPIFHRSYDFHLDVWQPPKEA